MMPIVVGTGLGLIPALALASGFAVVTVPVVDIRNEAKSSTPGKYEIDRAQETQVLLGDALRVTGEKGEWLEVEVLAQETYKANERIPYPGLIERRFVRIVPEAPKPRFTIVVPSATLREEPREDARKVDVAFLGTRLEPAPRPSPSGAWVALSHPSGKIVFVPRHEAQPLPDKPVVSRESLVALATRFLGSRYHWGGFSFPFQKENKEVSTGIDCSGLMGLVYRAQGVTLPRNARDIYRSGEKIRLSELRKGDFVFIAKSEDPLTIRHVMMYDEEERFIESTNADQAVVRFSTFPALFGLTREAIDARGGRIAEGRWVMAARLPEVRFAD